MNKGKKERRQLDVLNDSPARALISIGTPLVVVSLLSIAVQMIMSRIYSAYVGQIYFTVTGSLSTIVGLTGNTIGSIVSAGWIKTAKTYHREGNFGINRFTMNALYSILIVEVAWLGVLLCGTDLVMKLLSVPESIYAEARQYYLIYVAAYMIVPIGTYLGMLVNGLGTAQDLFLANCISTCGPILTGSIVLILCKGGMVGAALTAAVNAVLVIVVNLILLARRKFRLKPTPDAIKPDPIMIWDIVQYGLVMALQIVFCNIGYLCAAAQTNKYLSTDYISVLSVSLPLGGIMSAFSTASMVFVPQNYGVGNMDRVKRFFVLATGGCIVYGFVCFAIFGSLGEWYYGRLFEDPQIIEYGRIHWFWQGAGYIFVSVIFVVRGFLDAVGLNKVALLSGVAELTGNLICAFWIIPSYGNIGRDLSLPLGWTLAAVVLLTSYAINYKRIYGRSTPVV